MAKAILYPYEDHLAITRGASDDVAQHTKLALLVVPEGIPYLVVDDAEVPSDPTYFNALTADFSTPDGIGISKDEYYALYPPEQIPDVVPPAPPLPAPVTDEDPEA